MAVHFHEEDLPAGVLADGPVAVDTETMGLVTTRDRLCVVQISDGKGDEHLVRFANGSSYDAPNLKAVLADPYTIIAALIPTAVGNMAAFGTDQDMVQRMLTAKNKRQSAVATILSGVADIPVTFAVLAIGILLAFLMVGAAIAAILCCLLWPLLILIQGAISTYFSTLWTLAWREWTAAPAATAA